MPLTGVFQGGLPILPYRRRQRGSGFLSQLRRHALPILQETGKAALPMAAGLLTDLVQGKTPTTARLKQMGRDIGAQAIESTVNQAGELIRSKAPPGVGDLGAHLLSTAAGRLTQRLRGNGGGGGGGGGQKRAASRSRSAQPPAKKTRRAPPPPAKGKKKKQAVAKGRQGGRRGRRRGGGGWR